METIILTCDNCDEKLEGEESIRVTRRLKCFKQVLNAGSSVVLPFHPIEIGRKYNIEGDYCSIHCLEEKLIKILHPQLKE